ncbi:hypothetical protein V1517DRAFT_374823 [Lipomyces orientalis]|uniref:Uncharacterized protein n=1 Tax=Lipomyces orientalis TaxID=1233043 RepID=A0ACC3TK52_9ASCO
MDLSGPVNNPELLFTFPGAGSSGSEPPTKRKRKLPYAIRRRRVIRSCVNCHRRKVKCDKLTPACDNCIKLDLDCQYYDNLNDGLDVLDEPAPGRGEEEEESDPVEESNDVDNGNSNSGSPEKVELKPGIRKVDVGYLSVDPTTGGSRYANGVFWGAYFKEMVDVSSILKTRNEAFNMDAIAQNEMASSLLLSHFLSNPNAGLDILYSIVPDKSVADSLVQHYFFAIHPGVPILNQHQFMKIYETFWGSFQRKLPVDTMFLPLLFVTLYGAALSICESAMFDIFSSPDEIITVRDAVERQMQKDASVEQQRALQNKFKLATEIALSLCHFPAQPSLQGLQASVILNTCTNAHTSDAGTGMVAMLIRVAQMMGLHRDPSNFRVQLELEEAQERRLVWWQLVHLDYVVSMSQGLPPIVHRLESDVKLPSECVIVNGEEHKDQIDCAILTMNAVSEGALLNCMILLTVYGVQKCSIQQINKLDEEILKVRPRMEARCRKMMQLKDDDPRANVFKDWAFYLMHAVNEKSYSYLHHPNYLKDEDVDSKTRGPNEPSVRENLLKSAINTLYYYLGFSKMPEFLVYVWYIRFLQPFHAIIIVLQDLYLNEPVLPEPMNPYIEDERLRVVEQVFQVLHLLRIADKSAAVRHAWHSMNKLRTGTWLKIGYLHPVGLPLISSNMPPEYASLIPSNEDNLSQFAGDSATTLEALIPHSWTISEQSGGSASIQPLSPALARLTTPSGNVVTSSNINISSTLDAPDNTNTSSNTGLPSNLASSGRFGALENITVGGIFGDLSPYPLSTSSANSTTAVSPSKLSNASSSPEFLKSFAAASEVSLESDVSDGGRTADVDNYDDLYNFAARMVDIDSWNRWDAILQG